MEHGTKRCRRCGLDRPLTDYNRKSDAPDGLQGRCRPCQSSTFRDWRTANPDSQRARKERFYAANPGAKAEHDRRYREAHPEHAAERQKRWREENRERFNARQRRRRTQRRAEGTAYERDREKKRAYDRRYYREHPDLFAEYGRTRRARERAAPGRTTAAQLAARVAYYGGRCWMCGAEATCIDHVKPLVRGGSDWPANLRPACAVCNGRKSHHWPGVTGLAVFIT